MKMVIAFVIGILAISKVQAQDAELTITPNKCVALKKGQLCYQSLRINFSVATKSDFCLMLADQQEPLQCWLHAEFAEFRYELASASTVEFRMINSKNVTLANASVNVAWVYKQPRKRNRWRLF